MLSWSVKTLGDWVYGRSIDEVRGEDVAISEKIIYDSREPEKKI